MASYQSLYRGVITSCSCSLGRLPFPVVGLGRFSLGQEGVQQRMAIRLYVPVLPIEEVDPAFAL